MQFLYIFGYGTLHGMGTNEFGKLWQVLHVEEGEKTDSKNQGIFQACVQIKISFYVVLFSFLAS